MEEGVFFSVPGEELRRAALLSERMQFFKKIFECCNGYGKSGEVLNNTVIKNWEIVV